MPATAVRLQAAGLVSGLDPFFNARIEQPAALTVHDALPAAYQWQQFTAAGGLLSYGNRVTEIYRQAGVYTGRILKGERPADLPVQAPTRYGLLVNLKTAKAIGLDVPASVLTRADEVIE